jgi:hypothetical protein
MRRSRRNKKGGRYELLRDGTGHFLIAQSRVMPRVGRLRLEGGFWHAIAVLDTDASCEDGDASCA